MALSPLRLVFLGKNLLKEKRHFFYLFGSFKFTQKILHYRYWFEYLDYRAAAGQPVHELTDID
jgi:hypothetical protein